MTEGKFNQGGVRIAVKWGLFNLQTPALEHLAGHIQKPVAYEQNNVKTVLTTTHWVSLQIYSLFIMVTWTLKH